MSDDDLYQAAIVVIQAKKHATATLLQRELRLSYSRALRILDRLEVAGHVTPPIDGNGMRRLGTIHAQAVTPGRTYGNASIREPYRTPQWSVRAGGDQHLQIRSRGIGA